MARGRRKRLRRSVRAWIDGAGLAHARGPDRNLYAKSSALEPYLASNLIKIWLTGELGNAIRINAFNHKLRIWRGYFLFKKPHKRLKEKPPPALAAQGSERRSTAPRN
jgi:hypothetical protein